ncbi:cysteine proteinase [Morchella conica CCBAS932]|uniref:Cysteine proteinase n=1 Tax=Morchella conica CCBAS932 TaxID=1392247 RepID=A0A3N4L6P5_9PEZI|nr:cysteine proteinase [Morchella conica CCBAS932]
MPIPIPMDDLLARHRKELRDLTSRTTQKKKAATKKTRKGVNAECEALERELKERHAREVAELENPGGGAGDLDDEEEEDVEAPATVEDEVAAPAAAEQASDPQPTTPTDPTPTPSTQPTKKPHRRKAALARRAAALATAASEAASSASTQPDLRSLELSQMASQLQSLSLTEVEIAPDGHCLYSAFAEQVDAARDYRTARRRCAEFMGGHPDDFAPFIEGDFGEHVRRVGETAEWGGQAEVLALARAYGVQVNVVQAEGRGVERMNEGAEGGEVWLGGMELIIDIG